MPGRRPSSLRVSSARIARPSARARRGALTLYERSAGRLPEAQGPDRRGPVIVSTPDPDDYPPLITRPSPPPERVSRDSLTRHAARELHPGCGARRRVFRRHYYASMSRDGTADRPACRPSGASWRPKSGRLSSASFRRESGAAPAAAAAGRSHAPRRLPAKLPAAPVARPDAEHRARRRRASSPPMPAAAGGPATLPAALPARRDQSAGSRRRGAVPAYRANDGDHLMRVRTEDGRTREETIRPTIREWISGPFIITIGNAGGEPRAQRPRDPRPAPAAQSSLDWSCPRQPVNFSRPGERLANSSAGREYLAGSLGTVRDTDRPVDDALSRSSRSC